MKLTKVAKATDLQPTPDARAEMIAECFPALSPTVRTLLSERPVLFEFLLRLERGIARGQLTHTELTRLAEEWSEKLPHQRGAIIYLLRDFVAPELDLGLPKVEGKRLGNRGKNRKRGPA